MRSGTVIASLAAALLAVFASVFAQDAPGRVGLEENFDTVEGWKKLDFPGEEAPLKEMKSENGVGVFVTHPAPLRTYKDRPNWLDGMTGYDAFSNVVRTYPELDLDKYRYLVVKIDEKSTPASIIINHVDLPVAYTTGVRAVDLSLYEDLRGKKPVEFRIQFLNTGMQLKIDGFRFVSELTAEEKKGLIPPGMVLKLNKLEHNATQGLDAVMKRADRPRMDAVPAETLCFRDTATGAVIWRMTGLQSGSSIVSDSARSIFNRSGSVMLFPWRTGGPQLYDFQKDEFQLSPYAGTSRFSPTEPDVLWCIEKTRRPEGIRFHKINIRTGMDEIAGEISFEGEAFRTSLADLGFAENTDQIAVGFRESPHVYIFDPAETDPSKRLRHIKLPMRLKGMELSPDGKRLFWNRCYWYEAWEMDLQTGQVQRRSNFGGSHAGGGGGLRLGHHAGLIISAPVGMSDPSPGDEVKIFLNYRSGWHTDYGHVASDRQWYIANGTAGDMANQLIMAATSDPGTVLQVAHQNTSRDNWGNNTVIRSSPDYTKLTWVSNIWGYDAVCVAYTRRPEPPYGFSGTRQGGAVVLKWQRPRIGNRSASETMGYNVYRSVGNGPFLPMNREPLTGESWRDEEVKLDKLYKYIVCAQEYSGIEGVPTNAFVAMPVFEGLVAFPAHMLHFEAEHGIYVSPPARQAFDGWTSGFRYVRIRKQLESENIGAVRIDMTPEFSGSYVMWLRVRAEGNPGKWTATVDQKKVGDLAVEGAAWIWARLEAPVQLEAGKRYMIVLTSADDGLSLDKFILAQDPRYVPKTLDDRFSTPPKKLQYVETKDVTTSSVHLAWWNPKAEPDLDTYDVYVGETPDFPTEHPIVAPLGLGGSPPT